MLSKKVLADSTTPLLNVPRICPGVRRRLSGLPATGSQVSVACLSDPASGRSAIQLAGRYGGSFSKHWKSPAGKHMVGKATGILGELGYDVAALASLSVFVCCCRLGDGDGDSQKVASFGAFG